MNIRQKQWQLYFLGYYTGAIDGIWGPLSREATEKLQQQSGIKVDGIFDPSTEDKSREIVDAIQDVLNKYTSPKLVNDGLAGVNTQEALKAYQESKGLPQTGIVDEKTWDKLMEESSWDEQQDAPNNGTSSSNNGTSSSNNRTSSSNNRTSSSNNRTSGTFWDEIKYFKREELKCKCGGRYCNGFPAEPQEQMVRIADGAREHFGRPAHNVSFLRCDKWNQLQGGVVNSRHRLGKAMDIRIDGVTGDALLAYLKKQPGVRYAYKINATNVHFDVA